MARRGEEESVLKAFSATIDTKTLKLRSLLNEIIFARDAPQPLAHRTWPAGEAQVDLRRLPPLWREEEQATSVMLRFESTMQGALERDIAAANAFGMKPSPALGPALRMLSRSLFSHCSIHKRYLLATMDDLAASLGKQSLQGGADAKRNFALPTDSGFPVAARYMLLREPTQVGPLGMPCAPLTVINIEALAAALGVKGDATDMKG